MSEIQFKTGVIRPIECMKEGWELIKDQYWLIFAITLVGMLIAGAVPFGILLGVMMCGIYFCLFQKLRGQTVAFEGLFKGFDYFGPGFVASLVLIVPAVILGFIAYTPLILMQISMINSKNPDPSMIFGYLSFFGIGIIVLFIVLATLNICLFFAYPLIIEHGLSGTAAFKLSARAVWNNLSGVIGFVLLEVAMAITGYALCLVGVYLMMPIMFAGALICYRKVFPALNSFNNPSSNIPPSPSAYQSAGSYN